MKQLSVKTTDCSCDKLLKVAQKCGFYILEGSKHCKVTNGGGAIITVIPRHSKLNKYTTKGILERFNEFGANLLID